MASANNHPGQTAAIRRALRSERLALREAMSAAEHRHASALIERHLYELLGARAGGCIGFCWPMRGEFDPRALVGGLLKRGWQACMPVVETPGAAMVFHAWQPTSEMRHGPHGTVVPAEAHPALPDVLLLPLVAFDPAGFRLGYGGGYFDRTLAALRPRPLTVGVGFELARTETIHPAAHDIPLEVIVTEAGISRPSHKIAHASLG
ncbi:MAG TPA: 5-formyltetrahydrofolate cyclo-ligase [Rhodocyclaceae bacterium]